MIWVLLVVGYVVTGIAVGGVATRVLFLKALKEYRQDYGRVSLPSHKKDSVMVGAFWIGLFWPFAGPICLVISLAFREPPFEAVKPEAKQDWIEGYDDNTPTMMDVDF